MGLGRQRLGGAFCVYSWWPCLLCQRGIGSPSGGRGTTGKTGKNRSPTRGGRQRSLNNGDGMREDTLRSRGWLAVGTCLVGTESTGHPGASSGRRGTSRCLLAALTLGLPYKEGTYLSSFCNGDLDEEEVKGTLILG